MLLFQLSEGFLELPLFFLVISKHVRHVVAGAPFNRGWPFIIQDDASWLGLEEHAAGAFSCAHDRSSTFVNVVHFIDKAVSGNDAVL